MHWSDPFSIIWGTGLIAEKFPVVRPHAIYAVRGKLTRDEVIAQGIDCPEVYGDPALLMAELFPRACRGEFEVGVVPHYADLNVEFLEKAKNEGAVLINPLQPLDLFLAQLTKCKKVISSSLHGIIFAHAYGIPAVWVRLSDRVIGAGFKFRDYYSSIGFDPVDTPCFDDETPLQSIADNCHLPISFDPEPLKKAGYDALRQFRADSPLRNTVAAPNH